MLEILLLSIGLLLIFEGLVYFLLANKMNILINFLNNLDSKIVKSISTFCIVLGCCLIYFTLRLYSNN